MLALCLALSACQNSQEITLKPSTDLQYDLFTCKGLTAENIWVGVTDEFLPEEDSQVVLVARLTEADREKIVVYELINPNGLVAFNERQKYPQSEVLGISFDMHQLMERGGEGEWKAYVYSDAMPIGQTNFFVGEKPEDAEDDERFFIIGEESLAGAEDDAMSTAAPSNHYADYIREVTPESAEISGAAPILSPATAAESAP
mgnify:CR=1 FL=1